MRLTREQIETLGHIVGLWRGPIEVESTGAPMHWLRVKLDDDEPALIDEKGHRVT